MKRESGESPELPRSGKQVRKPKMTLEREALGSPASRNEPAKSEDLPWKYYARASEGRRGGNGLSAHLRAMASVVSSHALEAKEIHPWPPSQIQNIQTTLADIDPGFPVREETPVMHVRKRNGALEPVDVNKIVRAVQRCFLWA